jgi:signal transduction histidine kinase
VRSFASRITLLLIGAFAIMLLLTGGFVLASRRDVDKGAQLPLPGRVAAIAALVERTPPQNLENTLAALNAPDLSIRVFSHAPPKRMALVPMPGVTALLRSYLSALGGRRAEVWRDLSRQRPLLLTRWARLRARAPDPLVLAVKLRDGRTVTIETRNALMEQITGLRLSLLTLLGAIVIGGVALAILRNQIRPLERLAAAVERFARKREVSVLPEQGAQEVRQLIAAFNNMQSQIVTLIAQRTRMTAAIGHDFGTYLTRLRLRADYISDGDQRARAVRDIEDMNALMADTLALAKLDQDAEPVEPVNIVALAQKTTARFRDAGSDVGIEANPSTIVISGRPTAVTRVFDNLIANAVKYGGACEISLRAETGYATILVDDRGPGIPADQRAAVLEPFYRIDPSRNQDKRGFGLGLAIVADIVRHHKGTLMLEDRPGGGLRVRIMLPLAQACGPD